MTNIQDRSRERRACDAVARCLEGVTGHQRSGAYYPEDSAGGQSAIDYAFDLAGLQYAFEHTVVEAFDGQLRTNEHFGKFVEPIEASLDRQMPDSGYFTLLFPIDPSNGLRPKAVARKQAEIIAWAKTAALELTEQAALLSSHQLRRLPPSRDMPNNDVTLSFREDINGDMGGRMLAQRKAPKNYEQLRIRRVLQAVGDKLPKLAKCKPARTVLVLENRDMALSNHWVISEGLEKNLQARSDIPDEVWLVDAVHEAFWVSICLRKNGVLFPYDGEAVRYREFVPSELSAA
jgi:hypothetical protein